MNLLNMIDKKEFISYIWLRVYFKQNKIKEISLKLKTHLTWLDIIVYKRELKNKIVLETFMLGDKDFI